MHCIDSLEFITFNYILNLEQSSRLAVGNLGKAVGFSSNINVVSYLVLDQIKLLNKYNWIFNCPDDILNKIESQKLVNLYTNIIKDFNKMPFLIKNKLFNLNIIVDTKVLKFSKLVQLDYIRLNLTMQFISYFHDQLNWNKICIHCDLEDEIIIKFNEKIDFKILTESRSLSIKILRKFYSRLDQSNLWCNQILSEKFIEDYYNDVDWEDVSSMQSLTENFIIKHSSQIFWNRIGCTFILSDKFMIKFQDKFNWPLISRRHVLSETLIRAVQHQNLNWDYISVKSNFTEDFIIEFKDKLNWTKIQFTKLNLSDNFINNYQHFIPYNYLLTKNIYSCLLN